MTRHRPGTVTALVILTAIGGVTSARPALAQQVDPKVLRKAPPPVATRPVFQVREGLGDMTKWVMKGGIDTDLTKQFRWRTNFSTVKFAVYEISHKPFPSTPAYQQVPYDDLADTAPLAPPAGTSFAVFTVNFTKAFLAAFGTAKPALPGTLYVRLVAFDAGLKPISPVSETITLSYAPPAAGTSFGHTMQVRLHEIRCIEATSGPGSDHVRIDIHGAHPTKSGPVPQLYENERSMDTGTTAALNRVIWEYNDLGFKQDVLIGVALRELDLGPFEGSWGSNIFESSGPNVQAFLSDFEKAVCYDDDCIGWPQYLAIGEADWQRVALGNQTIFKTLTFKGLGGHYEVRFRLNPK